MYRTLIAFCVFALLTSVSGFCPVQCRRLQTRLSVVMPDEHRDHKTMDGKNWFEQLVQAFIQSIPEVLRPPVEMDSSKVVYDPPTFDKVDHHMRFIGESNSNEKTLILTIALTPLLLFQPSHYSDPRKMHRKRTEAIDHFLERYNGESATVTERPLQMQMKSQMITTTRIQTMPPMVELRYPTQDVYRTDDLRFSSKTYKTVYWPLKKVVSASNRGVSLKAAPYKSPAEDRFLSDDGRMSSKAGSKTVYWPLKRHISNTNNEMHHIYPIKKPHEMKTALLVKTK